MDLQQVAYLMWEADGCPRDCGDRYWRKAVALDMERREREAAAALPTVEDAADVAPMTDAPVASPPAFSDRGLPGAEEAGTAHRDEPIEVHESSRACEPVHAPEMTQEPAPTEAQEPVPPLPSAAVEPSRDKAPLDPTFGWFDLAQAQVACAVTGISRLAGCHTLGDVAASQSDFFRESVQLMVDHSLRLVDRAQGAIDLERA